MIAEGIDVISFAAGEPDFDTPTTIVESAKQALEKGMTRYPPTPGLNELRKAISEKFRRDSGLEYSPQETIVSTGGKQVIYNALQVLIDEGDEVLLLAPFWMTYETQVQLAGGKPIIVQSNASSGFVPDPTQIENAITPRTRAIIINSPSNPTGAAIPLNVLTEITNIAVKHDLWIISDEIYEHLVYGHKQVSPASLSQKIKDRTVTVSGCSKSYAMTGWRIGFAGAPIEIIKAMSDLQDQVTSGATTFSQAGAVSALNLPQTEVEKMRAIFHRRRDLIIRLLRDLPQITVVEPKGAFYVFPDFSKYLDDVALANYLLEEAKVATVPGSVFYGPGHLRLSYATSDEAITEGVARIGLALSKLKA